MERTTINNVKFLVITANIGSLFEEVNVISKLIMHSMTG